jgi:hypothetical protein
LSGAKKLEDLTDEELKHYLESGSLPDIPQISPVLEFIQRFDLQPGHNLIPSRMLYNLFIKYYPRLMSRNEFCEQANKILPYDRTIPAFKLNKDNVLLSTELAKSTNKKRRNVITAVSAERLQSHFNAFFESIGLTKGNSRINWWVLYEIYIRDCKNRNYRKPRAIKVFVRYMQFHFESIPSETGPIFLINHSVCLLINKREYAEIEEKHCFPKEDKKRKLSAPGSRKERKSKNPPGGDRRRKKLF